MGIRGVDGKEKYVNTYNSAADDTNSVEGLNLEIKAYVAGEGQLAPLSPYYVIWLTGGNIWINLEYNLWAAAEPCSGIFIKKSLSQFQIPSVLEFLM